MQLGEPTRRRRPLRALVLILLLAAAAAVAVGWFRIGPAPRVSIEPGLPGIGKRTPVVVKVAASGRGLAPVRVEVRYVSVRNAGANVLVRNDDAAVAGAAIAAAVVIGAAVAGVATAKAPAMTAPLARDAVTPTRHRGRGPARVATCTEFPSGTPAPESHRVTVRRPEVRPQPRIPRGGPAPAQLLNLRGLCRRVGRD